MSSLRSTTPSSLLREANSGVQQRVDPAFITPRMSPPLRSGGGLGSGQLAGVRTALHLALQLGALVVKHGFLMMAFKLLVYGPDNTH